MQYRHYKGGIYEYICTAQLESAPDVNMVIYRASNGSIWARTAENFFETVDVEGKRIPRFALID